ncbi:MAG: YlxR family protein [Lachnospiraceae bacterium]|nr:YlxR family protein [Lachnospiraceae bacterium]
MRTCLGCRTSKSKKELIRVVRQPDGTIELDKTGRKNGRGAYICPDPVCLKKVLKNGSLANSLKTPIPEEIAERLQQEIGG